MSSAWARAPPPVSANCSHLVVSHHVSSSLMSVWCNSRQSSQGTQLVVPPLGLPGRRLHHRGLVPCPRGRCCRRRTVLVLVVHVIPQAYLGAAVSGIVRLADTALFDRSTRSMRSIIRVPGLAQPLARRVASVINRLPDRLQEFSEERAERCKRSSNDAHSQLDE
jgi:hypothetical protein